MATKQRSIRVPDPVYADWCMKASERHWSVARYLIEATGTVHLIPAREFGARGPSLGGKGTVVTSSGQEPGQAPKTGGIAPMVADEVQRYVSSMDIVPAADLPKPKPKVATKGVTAGIAPDEFPDDGAYVQTFADE